MYRNAYQRGMLTVFFSVGSKPLAIWDIHTKDGYVSRFLDQDIKSMVLEIGGTNVTILDETLTRRRFRVSNFQSTTQILPLCTVMPISLSEGWNQIQFNLAEFTRRAYKKQFVEVQKLKINANIRLRRIYFTERLIPEDELPPEYKLYFPLASKGQKDKKTLTKEIAGKENIKPSTSQGELKATDAAPKVEEKATSKTSITKSSPKTSVHSIKKVSSQESKKQSKIEVIPEGETAAEQAPTVTEEGQENAEQVPTVTEEGQENVEQVPTATEEGQENSDQVPPVAEGGQENTEPTDQSVEPPEPATEGAPTEEQPAEEANAAET